MTRPEHTTRRGFLKRVGATIAAPAIIRASALGADGRKPPSDRITLGYIGMGGRAGAHLGLGRGREAQMLAACDVMKSRRERIQDKGVARYVDFRELLARDDIDAVVITTPDHWKPIHVIESAKAGKDIFCEKPISRTIHEAKQMRDTVRACGRVFQTGTQQRSSREFRFAAEMVRSGRIGELKTVKVSIGGPSRDCYLPPEPVPDELDWDTWLGPAPFRPFNRRIAYGGCGAWSQYRDYAGGWINEWGSHSIDSAHWGMDMDASGPVEVIPPNKKDVKWLTWRYANGVVLYNDGRMSLGKDSIVFEGTEGKISVGRGYLETWPASLKRTPISPNEVHLYKSRHHHGDWLDAIRARTRPTADIAYSCRSVTVCHLGNLAHWLGRALKWDPVKEQFADDDEARRWLDRPRRQPWTL